MKKILTIQDISCVGQCSLTVALPIISAMGVETCILPTAILSTHTGGFSGYTFRDLTDDIPAISAHWQKENIKFDGIYTGYLGSLKQINYIKDIIATFRNDENMILVDPAMADNGMLYPGFDEEFVEGMKSLCSKANYLLPNITEASMILGTEYKEKYDKEYIENMLVSLSKLGPNYVLITGVSFEDDKLGVAMYDKKNNKFDYYYNERIPRSFHGTGDIFASAFLGSIVKGNSFYEAGKLAVDFTLEAIKATLPDFDTHKYGVHFEEALWMLTKK